MLERMLMCDVMECSAQQYESQYLLWRFFIGTHFSHSKLENFLKFNILKED